MSFVTTFEMRCDGCKTILASKQIAGCTDAVKTTRWDMERAAEKAGVVLHRIRRSNQHFCAKCSDGPN